MQVNASGIMEVKSFPKRLSGYLPLGILRAVVTRDATPKVQSGTMPSGCSAYLNRKAPIAPRFYWRIGPPRSNGQRPSDPWPRAEEDDAWLWSPIFSI